MKELKHRRTRDMIPWADLLPTDEWTLFAAVVEAANEREIPFAIGGGLANAVYAQRRRRTKDIDLFVLPEYRQALLEEVNRAGFVDYYDRVPYDRSWIYRG